MLIQTLKTICQLINLTGMNNFYRYLRKIFFHILDPLRNLWGNNYLCQCTSIRQNILKRSKTVRPNKECSEFDLLCDAHRYMSD